MLITNNQKSKTMKYQIRVKNDDMDRIEYLTQYCGLNSKADLFRKLFNNYITTHRLVKKIGYIDNGRVK